MRRAELGEVVVNIVRYIYSLVDPLTKEIRYVGCAIDVKRRFVHHIFEAKRKNINKNKKEWILSLLSSGKLPVCKILEEVSEEEWENAERKWIESFRDSKIPLLNLTDGGIGCSGYNPPELVRKKMSDWHPFTNKSHCSNGHEFNEKNTYVSIRPSNGREHRHCRICRAAVEGRRRARIRSAR